VEDDRPEEQQGAAKPPQERSERRRPRELRTGGEGLWDVGDAMAFLKVSQDYIYRQWKAGKFPGHKLPGGRELRFEPEDIRAFGRGEWSPPSPPKEAA
jgi:predicted DNA-binding transcriptional regulator AlpA